MSEISKKAVGLLSKVDGYVQVVRSGEGYVGALDAVEEYIADLEARAEKAEAMVEKLIEAGRMMKQPGTIEEFHRGRRDYNALVAKWKEQK
ncbi:MAG: hypothetical protein WC910_10325 [Bacteroidales bacterium]|jgi:hypothetical protein